MSKNILGIHHITAVSGPAHENYRFYTETLGLRLVKRTVNFDDPGVYHLYYGDDTGAPGTLMTFFPYGGPAGDKGSGQVVASSYPVRNLDFWKKKLSASDGTSSAELLAQGTTASQEPTEAQSATPSQVTTKPQDTTPSQVTTKPQDTTPSQVTTNPQDPTEAQRTTNPQSPTTPQVPFRTETRFGTEYVIFEDPHGMTLELYQSDSAPESLGPIGGATLKLQNPEKTEQLLTLLGLEIEDRDGARTRYRIPGSQDYLDTLKSTEPRARGGAGTVHHIALRVADDESQAFWREKLIRAGYQVSPVMDRNYFHSIYFRGPGGVLFELATDPPGMLIDESPEELGKTLLLPPQYEPHRKQIESMLDPLEEAYSFTEVAGDGALIVALHGTGGDEFDLLNLVSEIAPGNPVLSLRGNVKEGGARRFFRRLKPGVFDEQDLQKRTAELAQFIKSKPGRRVALGYSNGANMAAATLLEYPETFDQAILFRPMLGWEPGQVDLTGKRVFITIGKDDRIVSPEAGVRLAEVLRERGAEVQLHRVSAGHNLTAEDIELAQSFLNSAEKRLKTTA